MTVLDEWNYWKVKREMAISRYSIAKIRYNALKYKWIPKKRFGD